MMWEEFEKLAGYEVTYQDYSEIIEPMYMATKLSKEEFVKCIDRKRFALPTKAQMVREMKKEAQHLFDICGSYSDFESEQKLEKIARAYAKRFFNVIDTVESKSYFYFLRGYEYPELKRGCTYPRELVIGRADYEYERIQLVKEVA